MSRVFSLCSIRQDFTMPYINTPVTINKTSHQKTMKISRKSKKGRQCNGQKEKEQRSTKHYTID